MNTVFYHHAIFIDTSAIIALRHEDGELAEVTRRFFQTQDNVVWLTLNVTNHECYTRARYNYGYQKAIQTYDWLLNEINYVQFNKEDEKQARLDLERFKEHDISFHDALLGAVMKRIGVYRVLTFDHHFYCWGFEVLPGITRK